MQNKKIGDDVEKHEKADVRLWPALKDQEGTAALQKTVSRCSNHCGNGWGASASSAFGVSKQLLAS